MATATPVPFDRELAQMLQAMRGNAAAAQPLSADSLATARAGGETMTPPVGEVIGDRAVDFEERVVPGQRGAPDLAVTILRPRRREAAAPGLYNMHGGGLIMGNRRMDTPRLVDLIVEFGFVAVNVDYRLAPENPGTGPAEDCYAGLVWTGAHLDELGVDPARLVVMGGSAGGCLAAAIAMMARDRGGPALAGQILLTPMLDDRGETISSHQYEDIGTWDRATNTFAWNAVLGDRAGGPGVPPYAAPARATDLSNLPPAYIEVGAAELFRDEAVGYASRIWATGGQAELHVWAGAFHGFEMFCPQAKVSADALQARSSWIRRLVNR